jgi:hypothetical protein
VLYTKGFTTKPGSINVDHSLLCTTRGLSLDTCHSEKAGSSARWVDTMGFHLRRIYSQAFAGSHPFAQAGPGGICLHRQPWQHEPIAYRCDGRQHACYAREQWQWRRWRRWRRFLASSRVRGAACPTSRKPPLVAALFQRHVHACDKVHEPCDLRQRRRGHGLSRMIRKTSRRGWR